MEAHRHCQEKAKQLYPQGEDGKEFDCQIGMRSYYPDCKTNDH